MVNVVNFLEIRRTLLGTVVTNEVREVGAAIFVSLSRRFWQSRGMSPSFPSIYLATSETSQLLSCTNCHTKRKLLEHLHTCRIYFRSLAQMISLDSDPVINTTGPSINTTHSRGQRDQPTVNVRVQKYLPLRQCRTNFFQ